MAAVEETHWWYRSTRALLQEVFDRFVPVGGTFLDAGAGTGATGAWMAARGRVVALDVEPLALDLYRRAHPAAGVATADISRLPFAGDSFDAALCVTVLYHAAVPDPAVAVAELARVVRPGGLVVLMEPGVRRLFRAHDREVHGARRFSRGDLRRAMEHAGLEVVWSSGVYTFLIPPAAVKAVVERKLPAQSDIARHDGGVRGILPFVAAVERRVIGRIRLPVGLSVLAVGRRPVR